MAEHSFPCPHRGADTVGLKIIWSCVAPCPKCRRSVQHSAGAFATSCMAAVTVFGWLLLGLPASAWFFYHWAELGLDMRLFLALVLPVLGAIVLGQIAFVLAYMVAPFRPYGTGWTERPEIAPVAGEPPAGPSSVPLACPSCHAAAVTVAERDDHSRRVYALAERIRAVAGRGDTDFRPPLERRFLLRHRPDLVICFTEGQGPAPSGDRTCRSCSA
jgi:hypothetical protein